jgi:hypothetical protein
VAPEVSGYRFLVLDDVKLDADGTLTKTLPELRPHDGTQGNVLLVNGQQAPVELEVAAARASVGDSSMPQRTLFNLRRALAPACSSSGPMAGPCRRTRTARNAAKHARERYEVW